MIAATSFRPSLAFDIKIACQNYFRKSSIVKYDATTRSYKREAWYTTALRIVSWFTGIVPLIAGLSLYLAHSLAYSAIEERRKYWSGKGPDGTDLIREHIYQPDKSKLKNQFIYALQNSDVPKTAFENIFLHPCGEGRSILSFGNDTFFRDHEIPGPQQKTLHIFHQFKEGEDKEYELLQEWHAVRGAVEKTLQKLVNPKDPDINSRNLDRLAHGMVYKKVKALSQMPFGQVPDSLKLLLAKGKIDHEYEQAFKSEEEKIWTR